MPRRPSTLDIAFFGSSLVSAYWNGAATYYRGIIRALAARGHRVTFYEPDACDRQAHRDIPDPEWAIVKVYPATEDALYASLDEAQGADLIIKASGVGVFDRLLEKSVLDLKTADNLIAFWDVDAPATLDRVGADSLDEFRPLIPRYDFIFTYGGGEPVVRGYKKFGAVNCFPIYNALDPSTHYPVPKEERFICDMAFLGNRLPDREARVEEFFLKTAVLLPEKKFILGGNGWQDKPMPPNVKYIGHVYTADHNALNSTPLSLLNISRESMARYGFSPATRVFEAAGAGACIITDKWEGIEFFMEPGSEILVAGNAEEAATLLASLTAERAKAIGLAGKRRILSEHTYAHRALQFENILGIEKVPA
jgi:spore maturation protein CgeB